MPEPTARQLAEAYVFLRRVEHRIQYLTTSRPMCCPRAMKTWPGLPAPWALDVAPFCTSWTHRELVAQEFDTCWAAASKALRQLATRRRRRRKAMPAPDLDALLEQLPPALSAASVAEWRNHQRVQGLRDEARARLFGAPGAAHRPVVGRGAPANRPPAPADWLEPLLRRELPGCCWSALFARAPAAPAGRHALAARYLLQHPGVIDELAGEASCWPSALTPRLRA